MSVPILPLTCVACRARLSPQAAASCGVAPGTLVAVKVRHPGVESLMAQDFVLMDRAARLAGECDSRDCVMIWLNAGLAGHVGMQP